MNDDSSKFECQACLLNNKENNTESKVECDWYVNSPKHGNFFWLYVQDKSGPDGSMPEMVQSEIAHLLGWSNTKTHFMLKQAMVELIEALTKFKANQLLSTDPDQQLDVFSEIDPISNYKADPEE